MGLGAGYGEDGDGDGDGNGKGRGDGYADDTYGGTRLGCGWGYGTGGG